MENEDIKSPYWNKNRIVCWGSNMICAEPNTMLMGIDGKETIRLKITDQQYEELEEISKIVTRAILDELADLYPETSDGVEEYKKLKGLISEGK